MMKLKILVALIFIALLSGCADKTADYYTYGMAKSCYKNGFQKDCKNYIANDKLTLTVNPEKQEITYQLRGMRLDVSNIIFKTLADCKVVDIKNFSCEGLKIADGRVIDSAIFGSKLLSDSAWLFWYSNYLTETVSPDNIDFVNRNGYWITPAVILIGFILLIMNA
jgi:hypothetical protein